MHKAYRIFIGLLIAAFFLTFLSLLTTSGEYQLNHNPRAMDFLAFYTGAKLLQQSPTDLYNLSSQLALQHHIDPTTIKLSIFLPFLNPPLMALFFLPLINMGLQNAYALWAVINSALLLFICYFSYQEIKQAKWHLKLTFLLFTITFIPVLTSLIIGQLSLLICFFLLLSWLSFKRNNTFAGGFFLSLLFIKPQFLLLPFLAILVRRDRRLLFGFFSGLLLFVLCNIELVGINGMKNYLGLLSSAIQWNTGYGIDLMAQHSLQTLLLILFKTQSLAVIRLFWIILVIFFTLPTLFAWSKRFPYNSSLFAYQFSLLIIATLLISPHTHFHDLSLLLIIAIILSSTIKITKTTKKLFISLLFAGYVIELAGYLFDVWTQTNTRPLWILASVGYMIIFWFFLLKKLIKLQK